MGKAARAIIIENDKVLVMHRNKNGSQYYTLVGGRVDSDESLEAALIREVKEETGLVVTAAQLVYTEMHPEPYNEQYIFLCNVAPNNAHIAIQDTSEEAVLNALGSNTHTPLWSSVSSFKNLPFRTPQLQEAIIKALRKGFPKTPIQL